MASKCWHLPNQCNRLSPDTPSTHWCSWAFNACTCTGTFNSNTAGGGEKRGLLHLHICVDALTGALAA